MTVLISRIEAADLDTTDIGFLLQSAAKAEESWANIAKEIAEGRAVVWRILAQHSRGVLLTSVRDGMLFVWHLAGRGLWRNHKSIARGVQEIVKRNGLKGIQGESIPTIAKLLTRQGFTSPRSVVEWRV